MIYCPQCGTANQRGSHFCKECGSLLPQVEPGLLAAPDQEAASAAGVGEAPPSEPAGETEPSAPATPGSDVPPQPPETFASEAVPPEWLAGATGPPPAGMAAEEPAPEEPPEAEAAAVAGTEVMGQESEEASGQPEETAPPEPQDEMPTLPTVEPPPEGPAEGPQPEEAVSPFPEQPAEVQDVEADRTPGEEAASGRPVAEESPAPPSPPPSDQPAEEPVALDLGEHPSFELGPEEPSGLLAGLKGTVRPASGIDLPASARARPTSRPAIAAEEQARLFTEILNEPMASWYPPRPLPTPRQKRRGAPWLATLLLAASVLVPFFVSGVIPTAAGPTPGPVDAARAQIAALPSGGLVLVSVDYDASLSGEMDAVAQALLSHLIQRNIKIAFVSVIPTGPALAQRVLETIQPADYRQGYGRVVLNAGYIPGQEAGLNRLATGFEAAVRADYRRTPLRQYALGQTLAALGGASEWGDRLKLIILVSGTQDPLRWWIEQVGSQTSVPMVAAVSAAVEPGVRPYYDSGQLKGLVAGWPGASAYVAGLSPDLPGLPAMPDVAVEAQSFSLAAVGLLIVLANLVYWGQRAFGVKE